MSEYDLRELQRAEYSLLKDFTDFCDEHGIVYFLDAGTLLGAARHQGFIPWDDDVDLCMDVQNYKKLLKLYRQLPDKYFFQNYRTDPHFFLPWVKPRIRGTTSMDRSLSALDMHFGVSIDVFVMAGMARSRLGRKIQCLASQMLYILLNKRRYKVTRRPLSPQLRLFYALLPEFLRRVLARCAESILLLDTQHSEYCFNTYYDLGGGYQGLIPAAYFAPDQRVRLPFEDSLFFCPKEYDKVLSIYYGDWRSPPAEEQRWNHGDLIVDLDRDYREYYTGDD